MEEGGLGQDDHQGGKPDQCFGGSLVKMFLLMMMLTKFLMCWSSRVTTQLHFQPQRQSGVFDVEVEVDDDVDFDVVGQADQQGR